MRWCHKSATATAFQCPVPQKCSAIGAVPDRPCSVGHRVATAGVRSLTSMRVASGWRWAYH